MKGTLVRFVHNYFVNGYGRRSIILHGKIMFEYIHGDFSGRTSVVDYQNMGGQVVDRGVKGEQSGNIDTFFFVEVDRSLSRKENDDLIVTNGQSYNEFMEKRKEKIEFIESLRKSKHGFHVPAKNILEIIHE